MYICNLYKHPHPPRERLCLSHPSLTPVQSSGRGCEDRARPRGDKGPRGSHTSLLPTPCTPPAHDTGSGAAAPPWGSEIPGHPQAGEGGHTAQGLFAVCGICRAQTAVGGCGRTPWRSRPGRRDPSAPAGRGSRCRAPLSRRCGAPTLQLPRAQGAFGTGHPHRAPTATAARRGPRAGGAGGSGAIRQLCPGPARS